MEVSNLGVEEEGAIIWVSLTAAALPSSCFLFLRSEPPMVMNDPCNSTIPIDVVGFNQSDFLIIQWWVMTGCDRKIPTEQKLDRVLGRRYPKIVLGTSHLTL